jgi:hypothetical protein
VRGALSNERPYRDRLAARHGDVQETLHIDPERDRSLF